MTNPIYIHINRKYKVPLDSIISVTQKRWGSIWVKYRDFKTNKTKIAIAKNSMSNLLMIINNYRCMAQKTPILAIYEK
jgi:hypothetical protein